MNDVTERHPWDGFLFVLLAPDSVERGLVSAITDRIVTEGFSVVRSRLVHVSSDRLDAAFGEPILTSGEIFRYRLLDKVFEFGPSVAMVLRDRANRLDPYAYFRTLKGATDPVVAEPGSIRHDFGGINVLLGLIHAADSAARSAFEANLVAPELGCLPDRPPISEEYSGWTRLLDSAHREVRRYRETLSSHRARVIAACWSELPLASQQRAEASWREGSLADAGVGSQIAANLPEAHPAKVLLGADWRPGLSSLQPGALRRALAKLSLSLDPWEELVLSTSGTFAADPLNPPTIHEAESDGHRV